MKSNNGDANIGKIAEWLETVRFRKKFLGGVSEQDVWKKISELNDMYQAALDAERIRYDSLIEEYKENKVDNQDGEMAYDE